jgi:hypothetical protein
MKRTVAATALGLAGLLGLAAPAAAAGLQRFALVAGANDGGTGRVRLKYAVSDATRFGHVLKDLGGVEAPNAILLQQPTRAQLEEGLRQLGRRVEAARRQGGTRTEVVVYYSGHADEEGLLLGGDRYSYRTLREALDTVNADVRIAVLDACASGAITRLKGGQPRPPFTVDASSSMRGHAFLTSSAADETAQESDRIGASYFTYYLISGLRGAADLTGEGTVTLNEAYQFAFRETLGRTVGTRGGAQHPSYDINMSGAGDVVMTDLRSTAAALVLEEGVGGRCFVRDDKKQLVVELQKPRDRRIELGLAAGTYEVRCQDGGQDFVSPAALEDGKRVVVANASFTPARREATLARGDEDGPFTGGRTRVGFGLMGDSGRDGFLEVSLMRSLGGRLAVGGRLQRHAGNSSYTLQDSYYNIRTEKLGFMAQLRLDLRHFRSGDQARPYLFAGVGAFRLNGTSEQWPDRIELTEEGFLTQPVRTRFRSHELGTELGLGLDAALGRRFTLGVRAGYRGQGLRPDGVTYGVTLGWLFGGDPRP